MSPKARVVSEPDPETISRFAVVEPEKSPNPGPPEAPASVQGHTGSNPGTEQILVAGNPGEGEGPAKAGLPTAAIVLGVGLAALLAWAASRPSA